MSESQNVILLTIDCLRADNLSCYGYPKLTSPNIDKLAKKGALFTQAISNGCDTTSSFPAILTSRYALMNAHRGDGTSPGSFWLHLSELWPSVAEVLRDHGFFTAAFNPNPAISSYSHFDKGFDLYEDFLNICRSRISLIGNIGQKMRTLRGDKIGRASILTKKTLSCIKDAKKNFFLWLHFMDVHGPYNPKHISFIKRIDSIRLGLKSERNPQALSKDELERLIDFYDQEIMYVDSVLETFLNEMEEIGTSLDNTYIILTADHGEQFSEHGHLGHGTLYDEVIRVPLIICGPGIDQNRVIRDQVSLLDLSPTMVDLLGMYKVESFLGQSLLPLIKGEEQTNDFVFSESISENISCRTDEWKLIFYSREGRRELYDLKTDSGEERSIAEENFSKINELESFTLRHIEMEKSIINSDYRAVGGKKMDLPDKVEKVIKGRLRELGYL